MLLVFWVQDHLSEGCYTCRRPCQLIYRALGSRGLRMTAQDRLPDAWGGLVGQDGRVSCNAATLNSAIEACERSCEGLTACDKFCLEVPVPESEKKAPENGLSSASQGFFCWRSCRWSSALAWLGTGRSTIVTLLGLGCPSMPT